jgi:hypothetical protein
LLDKRWQFSWDYSKRRMGVCWYNKRVISLSAPLTLKRDEAAVVDTILHEIAHALVGKRNGHNKIWKAKAIAIGCSAQRTYDFIDIGAKWIGICPNGHKHYRYRKLPIGPGSCSACSKKYNPAYTIVWTEQFKETDLSDKITCSNNASQ